MVLVRLEYPLSSSLDSSSEDPSESSSLELSQCTRCFRFLSFLRRLLLLLWLCVDFRNPEKIELVSRISSAALVTFPIAGADSCQQFLLPVLGL